MSLYKQLWLAVIVLMSLAFSGSFMVSSMTLKHAAKQQLHIKNIDNANNLALAATQLAQDETMVELLLAAQFDSGHYQYIRWLDPDGQPLLELRREQVGGEAPTWFKRWNQIEAPAGIANIQAGWQQLGSIELQSDPAFVHQALWDNTLRLIYWFSAAILLFGAAAHLLMKVIIRPLGEVVEQSRAMRQRHFVKVAPPRTVEFRELVDSMNALSSDIETFFDKEAAQLQRLQKESRQDVISGTASREHFLKSLATTLASPSLGSEGCLILLRIHDLQGLNRLYDRRSIDAMLAQIGKTLNSMCESQPHWQAGRLNGSDFAVLAPEASEAQLREVHQALIGKLEEMSLSVILPAATYAYHTGESLSQVLSRADAALAIAENRGTSVIEQADSRCTAGNNTSPEFWRELLHKIINGAPLQLKQTHLLSVNGDIVYRRPALHYQEAELAAGHRKLAAWAARLGMSHQLDNILIDAILADTTRYLEPLALTLSSETLLHPETTRAVLRRLAGRKTEQLQFHIPEYLAMQDLARFRALSRELKSAGYTVGLVNAGHHLENIGKLYDCGADYLVLDSSLSVEIESSKSNQILARSLATLFHSISAKVYADGISNEAQWREIARLGIDGGSGVYVEILAAPSPQ